MPLSWNENCHRAIAFSKEWTGVKSERAEKQTFWNEFFNVFGIRRRVVASFEEPVKKLGGDYGYIDLFWSGIVLVEHKSAGEASREYGIKDSVLARWKQEFVQRAPKLFEQGPASDDRDRRIAELERMVGRLATELEMAKKVSRYLNSASPSDGR